MNQSESKEKIINRTALARLTRKVWAFFKPVFLVLLFAAALVSINTFYFNREGVNHALILQYLDVLRWPIFIIVAALIFKDHLPGILNRARKIGPGGIELDPADRQSKISPNAEDLEKAADKGSDVDISTPKGRASALKNVQLRYALEKVYRAIFGTQIEALQLLAQYERGLSEADLQPILRKHQLSIPDYGYSSVIEFMAYLRKPSLIEFSDGIYKITDLGRLFLDYLAEEMIGPHFKNH